MLFQILSNICIVLVFSTVVLLVPSYDGFAIAFLSGGHGLSNTGSVGASIACGRRISFFLSFMWVLCVGKGQTFQASSRVK